MNKMKQENKKNIEDLKEEKSSSDSDSLEVRIQELKIIESNES